MSLLFQAIEFESTHEAIQHTEAAGGEAILISGRSFVVKQDEADRLFFAGVEFAYLCPHEMQDGTDRIFTIPVN